MKTNQCSEIRIGSSLTGALNIAHYVKKTPKTHWYGANETLTADTRMPTRCKLTLITAVFDASTRDYHLHTRTYTRSLQNPSSFTD